MEKIMLSEKQIRNYINLFNKDIREELIKRYLNNNNYLYLEKFNYNDFEGYDYGLYDKDGLVDKVDYDNFMIWIGK